MSGQLAAAQQRTLGTAPGLADPVKTFLGSELQGAPYPCTYPCKHAYPSTDSKVSQSLPCCVNTHCTLQCQYTSIVSTDCSACGE